VASVSVRPRPLPVVRAAIHVSIFVWLLFLVYRASTGLDGPDPIKSLVLSSGEAALILLFASLSITPARRLLKNPSFIALRRPIGLWAFTTATLHLLVFAHGYLGWQVQLLLEELNDRPYILVGTLAWVLLLPLAATSTRGWQRSLGSKWKTLHQAVYFSGCLVCIHIIWQVRSDWIEAGVYTLIYVLILGSRYRTGLIFRLTR
jgi:sulfoxide reductase heme-binding subunit YedZ